MKELKNRVAVLTGAGGGLGRCIAQNLANRGCHLALVDINPEALQGTADAVESFGVRVSLHPTDITSKEQMAALPAAVLEQHEQINIIINNAGITLQKSFATHSIEDWERIIGINLWGVIYGCHYFLDELKKADEAHIVNLSSMNAFLGMPGQSSYCATKAAVKLLNESLWAELSKEGIGVTSVHPGAIKTDMIQATLKDSDDLEQAQKNYELAHKIGVTPEHVAERIVQAILKNHMRIRVGKDSVILELLKRWFPVLIHKPMRKIA